MLPDGIFRRDDQRRAAVIDAGSIARRHGTADLLERGFKRRELFKGRVAPGMFID